MSNLQTAKSALMAEIEHAQQGLAHYEARILAIEQVLASLDALDGASPAASQGKRGRKPRQSADRGAAAPSKRGAATRSAGALPPTGKEFWVGLLASEPRSSKEILEAAVESLAIKPSKNDLKKLAQRQANALHLLVKAKAISDSGSGRQRRYALLG